MNRNVFPENESIDNVCLTDVREVEDGAYIYSCMCGLVSGPLSEYQARKYAKMHEEA